MKINVIDGCTVSSLKIDGIEETEMTDEQRKECIVKLCEGLKKVIKSDDLNYFAWHVCEMFGEYKSEGQCPTCGDYIDNFTLELD